MNKTKFMNRMFSATAEEQSSVASKIEEAKENGVAKDDAYVYEATDEGNVVVIDKEDGEKTEVIESEEEFSLKPIRRKTSQKKFAVSEDEFPEDDFEEVPEIDPELEEDQVGDSESTATKVEELDEIAEETINALESAADKVEGLEETVKEFSKQLKELRRQFADTLVSDKQQTEESPSQEGIPEVNEEISVEGKDKDEVEIDDIEIPSATKTFSISQTKGGSGNFFDSHFERFNN